MGLIKDTLGAALGSNQVKTGFNGPQLPFINKNIRPTNNGQSHYTTTSYQNQYASRQPSSSQYLSQDLDSQHREAKSSYATAQRPSAESQSYFPSQSPPPYQFRPLALPQVDYGDGQPFLRGYSHELESYGISQDVFISILDRINTAVIPNPEVQIFQKAASIAGWFVPGSASLGLMAGQFAVGIGNAFGHASMVSRSLSKANLDVFLPQGLEICIGKSKDVDNEVGVSTQHDDPSPMSRIQAYGDLIAPLTAVLPPQQNLGRKDPLAMLGSAIGKQANGKKVNRAQKDLTKGKGEKYQKLESGLAWLMVRPAKPDTLAHWQKVLQQSEAALREENAVQSRMQQR